MAAELATPTSNDTRVLVEDFSKISATDLPAIASACREGRSSSGRPGHDVEELRRCQIVDRQEVTGHAAGV